MWTDPTAGLRRPEVAILTAALVVAAPLQVQAQGLTFADLDARMTVGRGPRTPETTPTADPKPPPETTPKPARPATGEQEAAGATADLPTDLQEEADDQQEDEPAPADDEAPDTTDLVGSASYFASSLTLGAGRDSGLRAAGDGGETLDDTVFIARPTLLLVERPSGRTELLIGYEPELETYQDHSELNTVDHDAGVAFQHRPTRHSRILAGGTYLDGEDPGRHLGGLLVLLPRVPYRQWRAYAGTEYAWRKTGLLLLVGHSSTSIDPGPGLFGAGIDETENTASLTLSRTLGPRTDFALSYSWVDPTYDSATGGDGGTADDGTLIRLSEPLQSATLGLGFQASPRVSLYVTGGALDDGVGDNLSFIGSAEIVRTGETSSLRLRYDRSIFAVAPAAGPAAGPIGPVTGSTTTAVFADTVTQAATVSFAFHPLSRLLWQQILWAETTDLPNDRSLDSLAATTQLTVELTRRLGAFVRGEYLDQSGTDLVGEPFSRTFVSVGLIVGLTGPSGAWGLRERPAALDRVLPYREGNPR